MNIEIQQPPQHSDTCRAPFTNDLDPRCPGCRWMRRCWLENLAWQRWLEMVAFYPRDSYGRIGLG